MAFVLKLRIIWNQRDEEGGQLGESTVVFDPPAWMLDYEFPLDMACNVELNWPDPEPISGRTKETLNLTPWLTDGVLVLSSYVDSFQNPNTLT